MPILPVEPSDLFVGSFLFQVVSRFVCGQLVLFKCGVRSDGDEGPDDGTGHVHPEEVFHFDCKQCPFPICRCH